VENHEASQRGRYQRNNFFYAHLLSIYYRRHDGFICDEREWMDDKRILNKVAVKQRQIKHERNVRCFCLIRIPPLPPPPPRPPRPLSHKRWSLIYSRVCAVIARFQQNLPSANSFGKQRGTLVTAEDRTMKATRKRSKQEAHL